jgi:arylsulfatase A-like enzyme
MQPEPLPELPPNRGNSGGHRLKPLNHKACSLLLLGALLLPTAAAFAQAPRSNRPNIVYILCDDLGYGDIHAFNPGRGKILTPNVDRLTSQGMSFTDTHSASSVCTPSRYGILTGRYAWRTRLQSDVLYGSSPPLIAADRLTVAELLRRHGYATMAIGKWHLGLAFGDKKYTDPLTDGPLQHGFDSFFGISASLDMPPFAYIEDQRFPEEPSVEKTWLRTGPAAVHFEAINVMPDLTHRAVDFISAHAQDARGGVKPFFLYLAFTGPHTPIVPTPEWEGKSGLGPYADFVMEVDELAGEVLNAIDAAGLADDTLVAFASDNGCSPMANTTLLESEGHFPSAGFRGYKADIWDGGHRIPFIVRWPGKVKAGSQSAELTCLTDLMATVAQIIDAPLPATAAEDSVSILPALLNQPHPPLREAVVHHSIDGMFAIRKGRWKLELCAGSGGWSAPTEPAARTQGLPPMQLYDMEADPAEKDNVASANPHVVAELTALLEKYVSEGRSTPGEPQRNDAPIDLRKTGPTSQPAAAHAEIRGD